MANVKSLKIGDTTYNLDSYNSDYASSAPWSGITGKPINLKNYSGSLSSGGWETLNGLANSPSIAIAYNSAAANWNSGTYSATMVWGCSDTRGLLDCAYSSPVFTVGGANYAGSSADNPVWYMKITGTSGSAYNLDKIAHSVSGTTLVIS